MSCLQFLISKGCIHFYLLNIWFLVNYRVLPRIVEAMGTERGPAPGSSERSRGCAEGCFGFPSPEATSVRSTAPASNNLAADSEGAQTTYVEVAATGKKRQPS